MVTFLDKEEAQGTSVCLDSTAETDEDAKLVNEDEEAVEDVFSLLGLVGVDLVGLLCS